MGTSVLVQKRNETTEYFNSQKIYNAILKAMKYGSGIVKEDIAMNIANEITSELADKKTVSITNDIEPMVFAKLCEKGEIITARMYEAYRAKRELQRQENALDEAEMGIVDGFNKEEREENSNKNPDIAATQRDLMAGTYSRDFSRRKKLPINITVAHDEGQLHFHDTDYFIQHIHNCCLVNLEDMLQNGTVINGKMIRKPKSFQTACTIATQIVQQVANGQYGGQTISLTHLAPFVRISHDKIKNAKRKEWDKYSFSYTEEILEEATMTALKEEIKAGVQTIQYQINTFSTSNGQAPFLSVFMYLNENTEYTEEIAMIIEEMLKQRIQGIENEQGVYVTPSFPKLLYVLDDNNTYEDSEYFYLTKLATECVTKRMVPDFISAKIMRQNYDNEVFPCMGCRSFLSPWKDPETGKYKWYGRFNQGVVTLNLVDVGLSANKNESLFWSILDERLELCKQALMLRYENLKGTSTRVSPIHFRYGALARLGKDKTIDSLLLNGYSTISLGYAGLYECVMSMLGESHTTEKGEKFALDIMNFMKNKCEFWKKETTIAFGLYGTPLESTTYKFARCLKNRFGIIPEVTDHDYITNSYHVNVRERINPFKKLKFESQFQSISSGGAISYIETENMVGNEKAILQIIQYIYENIQYAELNGKFDYCHECGHTEMKIDENNEWYCPNCGNKNKEKMNVARRTCGYIGDNYWNSGRTAEIKDRVTHLANYVLQEE